MGLASVVRATFVASVVLVPLAGYVSLAGSSLKPVFGGAAGDAVHAARAAIVRQQPAGGALIRPDRLTRLGSFRLPGGISAGPSGMGFEYGGNSLAFNPSRTSLYLVGHDWDQYTAEISIPVLNGTATILQELTDASENRSVGPGTTTVGGHLVYGGHLILTKFLFYDAAGSQTVSHFVRPLSLAVKGQVEGPYRVGSLGAGFYSGYMGLIPSVWQTRLGGPVLTGNCCLSIISRTSFGPAVFAIDPANFGLTPDAVPLLYYTQDHQTLGPYGAEGSHAVFNGTTRIRGVVFPEGTSSVLFFGSTGVGNYCYGEAAACGAPGTSKGEHAPPYRAYVWAYDANDLAAVKAGKVRPWAVKPYGTWELPLGDIASDGIGGAAYDPVTGRIFLSQRYGDAERPLIHVYSVQQ